MRQITRLAVWTKQLVYLVLVTLLFAASNCLLRAFAENSDDIENWVRKNYVAVLNLALPCRTASSEKPTKTVKWIVTVRILPPFEDHEYLLTMHKTYDGKVEVSTTFPKRDSVYTQLRNLRRNYPESSIRDISQRLSLEHRMMNQSDDPNLVELANEIERISISAILPDEVEMDATTYEFQSQSLWGNRLVLRIGGPGRNAKKQPYPLLRWVESVRSAIGASSTIGENRSGKRKTE